MCVIISGVSKQIFERGGRNFNSKPALRAGLVLRGRRGDRIQEVLVYRRLNPEMIVFISLPATENEKLICQNII